jgi:penicillin-binding protein 2
VDPTGDHGEAVAAGPSRKAPVSAQVDAYLRASLEDAAANGSVRALFGDLKRWPIAGKTGTGEVAGKRDTSWYVSYAPADQPRWVVSVVVAQGGPGMRTAAPVARAVHETLRTLR